MKAKHGWYIVSILAISGVLLFLFRYELLFAYQRMRLQRLPANTKVWVHRVNSYARFNYMKDHFPGMETDVVFDASIKQFRVYHPPAARTALTLDTYLKWLKPYNKSLWIDVKGVDTAEYAAATALFLQYDRLYDIKEHVIIESAEPGFINKLAEQGFITSFLVPPVYLQANTPQQTIDSIKHQLIPAVRFVSQEDIFLPWLKTRFKERKILTWALSFSNYYDLSHFRSLIADTSISVILVNGKSKGYL